jgi:endogenous inhibitor of DNA gyrase (YacG/DUF329 family)
LPAHKWPPQPLSSNARNAASVWSPESKWRPFCSSVAGRSTSAWASERYRVKTSEAPDPATRRWIPTPCGFRRARRAGAFAVHHRDRRVVIGPCRPPSATRHARPFYRPRILPTERMRIGMRRRCEHRAHDGEVDIERAYASSARV